MLANKRFVVGVLASFALVGAITVAAIRPTGVFEGQSISGRTLTIGPGNRQLKIWSGDSSFLNYAIYDFQDGYACGLIYASQSQEDVRLHGDYAVIVVWGNAELCAFDINSGGLDGKTISKEFKGEPVTVVKYRCLTRIDIELSTGNGSDRFTELASTIDGHDGPASFRKIGEDSSYKSVTYEWTPDTPVVDGQRVRFTPASDSTDSSKAIWVRGLTFYYDC